MDGNQLCGRCQLYISFDKKEISKDEAERGDMCLSCSKIWGRLAKPDSPCGECVDRDDKMVAIQQSYDRLRESASEDRLTHPQPVPRHPPPPPPPKSSRTAEYEDRLTNNRSKVGNFRYLIVVAIAWNGPKDVLDLHPFGRMGKEYGPMEVFVTVLKDLFTSLIMPWWAQSQQVKLDFEDITWSFATSKLTLDPVYFKPENPLTLGTFVADHSPAERYAQWFAAKEMKKGGGGVKQFVLHAFLNYKKAMMRAENHYTSLAVPFGPLSSTSSLARPFAYSESGNSANARRSASGTKRRNEEFSSSEDSDEGAVREGRPVTRASAKIPQSPEKFVEKRVAPSTRQIVFHKRYAAVYGKTWAVHESRAETISGTVTESAFNTSGETKNVFILTVGEEEFAAKQFRDSILQDDDTDTNLAFLEGELVRAAILRTQLQGFRDHVKKIPGVEEIVDIHPFAMPQTFIARETTLVDGMKQHYICEPLRNRTEKPIKFSGVNKAGNNAGAAGGTADALAHYSLIASKGNLVLVDLQAMRVSPEVKREGTPVLALFDPMCHISQFGSGLSEMFFQNDGDAGIDAWKAQHRCNAICRALGLDKIEPTAPDDQRPPTTQTVLAIDGDGNQFFEAQVGKPDPPKYDHAV
ncbi:hypothetical protein FS837_004470 [Tulasnella sp. UAMH 9824]|nr:hypothetical protein FS837_004470 [Tulasnella sp. UAMH 9824]